MVFFGEGGGRHDVNNHPYFWIEPDSLVKVISKMNEFCITLCCMRTGTDGCFMLSDLVISTCCCVTGNLDLRSLSCTTVAIIYSSTVPWNLS